MQMGTDQYDRGNYADAEKMFQGAQKFADRLDPLDQRKLQSLAEKASRAAAERKKALEAKQAGQDLLRKGDTAGGRARLESIQSSTFLSEEERLEVAQLLRTSGQSRITGTASDSVSPQAGTSPDSGANTQNALAPSGVTTQETDRIGELYYQSMLAYHSRDLKKARQGFTELLKSEGLPASVATTIRGYLAEIDNAETAIAAPQPETRVTAPTAPSMLPVASPIPTAMPYRAATEPAGPAQGEAGRIQALYNRSLELYSAGDLEGARRGFVEVARSGQFTAAEGKRPEDYIAAIDRLLATSAMSQTPAAPQTSLAAGDPAAAVPAEPDAGGFVGEINRRRSIIRSHTQAVVTNAVNQCQRCLAQGEFDKAREVVFDAQRRVNEYQGQLGEELYRQYTVQCEEANASIAEAQAIRDKQLVEQRRLEAAQTQQDLRKQAEIDRKQRIDELMERAKAYQQQQRYEAALGQLEMILAIDPLHDEALRMKQATEDTIYPAQAARDAPAGRQGTGEHPAGGRRGQDSVPQGNDVSQGTGVKSSRNRRASPRSRSNWIRRICSFTTNSRRLSICRRLRRRCR